MSREGGLAEFLAGLTPAWMRESGQAARARAVALFSKEAVIGRYCDYYQRVAGARGKGRGARGRRE